MENSDNLLKIRIIELVNNLRRLHLEAKSSSDFEKLSEEDVKVKFIYPFFEILGWNLQSHKDSEMEYHCGYKKEIYQELTNQFPDYKLDEKTWDKEYVVDCVLKINNNPYIFIEAKRFTSELSRIASLKEPTGYRIMENALRMPDTRVEYVVYSNFIKTVIVEAKTRKSTVFEDVSEYVSHFNNLKILMKPRSNNVENVPNKPECFEDFRGKTVKCENCADIQSYICKASTKLKHLGYELKPIPE